MTAPLLLALLAAADPKPPLDESGFPLYAAALNDRLGRGITPETNANVLLWAALGPTPGGEKRQPPGYFRRLGIPEPPAEGDYFVGQSRYLRDRFKLGSAALIASNDEFSRAISRPWTAADLPRVAGWLAANDKPLAVVTRAARRPAYFNPHVPQKDGKGPGLLIGALLPSVAQGRELGVALCARAMFRLGEGKPDAAWQDLLTAHRLARLIGRGGTLLEGLIGIAIETFTSNAELAYLERAGLTAAQIRARVADLDGLSPLPAMADKIDLAERYVFLNSFQLARGTRQAEARLSRKLTPDERAFWASLDWTPADARGNQWYDRIAAAMRLPTRAGRVAAFDRIDADLARTAKRSQGGLLAELARDNFQVKKLVVRVVGDAAVGMLLPEFRGVRNRQDVAEQMGRNLRVAFALAAYRTDTGSYPAKLADLAPKYLPAVPGDLFTGKELVYRVEGPGYLLYSVGINGKDDGGRWHDDDPPGDDPRVRTPLPSWKKPK